MAASKEIAHQWHEGSGAYFSQKIRVLMRHYQLFEQLPVEKRGTHHSRSLLNNEEVQKAARTYLSRLPTGEVTPKVFHQALNKRILPTLGLAIEGGLSAHTASRWLIRLGWQNTRLKKGVYMDGHERPDVVEYCQKMFLSTMALYEKRMAQWVLQGSELVHVDPDLGLGEKRIIALFQDDESSFHVNEYKQNIWYARTICSRSH
jgi:hypothetical protein